MQSRYVSLEDILSCNSANGLELNQLHRHEVKISWFVKKTQEGESLYQSRLILLY